LKRCLEECAKDREEEEEEEDDGDDDDDDDDNDGEAKVLGSGSEHFANKPAANSTSVCVIEVLKQPFNADQSTRFVAWVEKRN